MGVESDKKVVDMHRFGYDEPVILRKLTSGNRCDIEDAVKASGKVKIDPRGKPIMSTFPSGLSKILYIVHSLEKAPFPMNEKGVRDLPPEIFDHLVEEAEELNNPLDQEQKTTKTGT